MRSLAALLLLSVLAGCTIKIPPSNVTVPNTPEAQACWRQCEQIKQTCLNSCQGNLFSYGAVHTCVNSCGETRDKCYLSCPGATTNPPTTPPQ